jgi:hypothetical protein
VVADTGIPPLVHSLLEIELENKITESPAQNMSGELFVMVGDGITSINKVSLNG